MQNRDKKIEEMAREIDSEYDCIIPCQSCAYYEYANCRDVKSAEKLYNAGYRKSTEVAEEIFAEIEYAPTADVVEVRHGEWTDKPTGAYSRMQSWCSACGKHSGIGGIESNRHKPYCPNCGAKMDGERREDTDGT